MFKVGSNSGIDGLNGDRINGDFHGGGGIEPMVAPAAESMAAPGCVKLYAFVDICMNVISMAD
jgi:hypothetical protein